MWELAPGYLAEIARQLGFLSAFLGGFAATFLGLVLQASPGRRVNAWIITSAAFASVAFIIAVVATTMLVVVLHPEAPEIVVRPASIMKARVVGMLAFMLGTYGLLLSLGLSGWAYSRPAGAVTATLAVLGAGVVTWVVAGL